MTPVTTEQGVTVYRSNYGYHPCDYETFLKLKEINKKYWEVVKQLHAWRRWKRKEPQNRVIRKWLRDARGHKISSVVVGPRTEPRLDKCFLDERYLEGFVCWNDDRVIQQNLQDLHTAYRVARRPRSEDDVKPMPVSVDQINLRYSALRVLTVWSDYNNARTSP